MHEYLTRDYDIIKKIPKPQLPFFPFPIFRLVARQPCWSEVASKQELSHPGLEDFRTTRLPIHCLVKKGDDT
jgi:hypothetical protein